MVHMKEKFMNLNENAIKFATQSLSNKLEFDGQICQKVGAISIGDDFYELGPSTLSQIMQWLNSNVNGSKLVVNSYLPFSFKL